MNMGLGTWLLENVVADSKNNKKNAAQNNSIEEQKKKIAKEKRELAAEAKRISKAQKDLEDQIAKASSYSEYEVRLVCAKVAICSYIIFADKQVSEAEQKRINIIFGDIQNRYGPEVYDRALQAYNGAYVGFINVQDYLRQIQIKDIKMYLQSADEIAEADGVNEDELKAIQRIKDYVEQLETGSVHTNVCPTCSGMMIIDNYGYKAVCNSCGRETIVDASNAPESAYREINKPRTIVINEEKPVPEEKEVQESAPVKKKGKAGKVALKVALGVMTGGVSLIPDAVNAAKKKDKK
jgi:DNA-directed RNA polymerase subunit M/transcription elongation factor TFIIS